MKRRGAPIFLLVATAVFVLAQLGWWLVFQHGYVGDVTSRTLASWEADVAAASALGEAGVSAGAVLVLYPHLEAMPDGGFTLSGEVEAAFLDRQASHVRMFVNEGLVFAVVLLLGFWLIARRMRVEVELKQQQQNFLAAVSHEFRSPMSSLRLLIETLMFRQVEEERRRSYLEKMDAELGRLEQFSDTVLEAARLEEPVTADPLASLDLATVVRDFVASSRSRFEARGARLELILPDDPVQVSGVPASISLVLGNLIDNAVKYSPEGAARISVTVEADDHVARVHVDDQGNGIPAGIGSRVFDRFYRVGSELQRTAPGVGLGLHLVKHAAEGMNGWVRHQPNPNAPRGTRFSLMLPLRPLAASETVPSEAGAA